MGRVYTLTAFGRAADALPGIFPETGAHLHARPSAL